MAKANVEATVIIVDIGATASAETKNGPNFYNQAIACIAMIIERKIFSRPTDLVGIILMGTEESENDLASDGSYQHISVAIDLANPTWDMIEILKNSVKPSQHQADWFDALVVGADFLRNRLDNKKVSRMKVVLMTDFKTPSELDNDQVLELIENYKTLELEPIIIGHQISDIENEDNKLFLEKIVEEADGYVCSFEDANLQLQFHTKKATKARAWYVDLCIGPNIKIPVCGYGKIRESKVTIKWNMKSNQVSISTNDKLALEQAIVREKTFYKRDDNTAAVEHADLIEGYLYGQTIVPYSKIDTTMEYQSGDKCLAVNGFTKKENIRWSNLNGDGVTYLVAKSECNEAKSAIDALATVLSRKGFVAVARKVYCKNSAPNMVVLFPIVKKEYKCLSMINLSFKEDYNHTVFPKLDQKRFLPSEEQIELVDSLIKAMDLSAKDEKNKEIFTMDSIVNPKLQHQYDCIAFRAMNPGVPLPPPRTELQKFLDVPKMITIISKEPLEKIKQCFPLVIIEKTKGGKHWINDHFNKEEVRGKVVDLPPSTEAPTAASVLTTQITKIGSVNPVEDFKQLINCGKSPSIVCEQLTEVIENLVICSFGEDFAKPIAAMSAMRKLCILINPKMYNDWLNKFKAVLLDKFKIVFLQHLLDQNLGLITSSESTLSSITDREVTEFGNVSVNESISNPIAMDTSAIDDLFADDF